MERENGYIQLRLFVVMHGKTIFFKVHCNSLGTKLPLYISDLGLGRAHVAMKLYINLMRRTTMMIHLQIWMELKLTTWKF